MTIFPLVIDCGDYEVTVLKDTVTYNWGDGELVIPIVNVFDNELYDGRGGLHLTIQWSDPKYGDHLLAGFFVELANMKIIFDMIGIYFGVFEAVRKKA